MTTQTARPSKILVQCLNVQVVSCILFAISAWTVADFGRISVGRDGAWPTWFSRFDDLAAAATLVAFAAFGWMTISLVRPDPSSDRRIQVVAIGFLIAAGVLLLLIAAISCHLVLDGVS